MPANPDTPNYHPLVRAVAGALRKRCKVEQDAAVVVGCSGGADSVALVRALALLAGRRGWGLKPIVTHVQHHLRGPAGEEDAGFVARLASELGLGYERRDIHPDRQPGNLEASARKLRYRALADVALKRGAKYVATAHHADDQLETLLMRLLRGSGVRGLRGIAWRRRLRTADEAARVYAVRPMLVCERVDAVGFLHGLGQDWREDATNQDTARTRARLRHEVVPLLKAIRADAAGKAAALTDHFDDLHRLVLDQAEQTDHNTLDAMPRDEARAMNPVVLMQLLRRDLIHAGVNADRLPGHALRPVAEAVRDDVGGVRTFAFAGGVEIRVTAATLHVKRVEQDAD